jgi:hypothetical protein
MKLSNLYLSVHPIDRSSMSVMHNLGHSLGDVAAFMQEIEINQGLTPQFPDGRGIERLRKTAAEMTDSGKQERVS